MGFLSGDYVQTALWGQTAEFCSFPEIKKLKLVFEKAKAAKIHGSKYQRELHREKDSRNSRSLSLWLNTSLHMVRLNSIRPSKRTLGERRLSRLAHIFKVLKSLNRESAGYLQHKGKIAEGSPLSSGAKTGLILE